MGTIETPSDVRDSWSIPAAEVAAGVVAAAGIAALCHPELANAADTFGERYLDTFCSVT